MIGPSRRQRLVALAIGAALTACGTQPPSPTASAVPSAAADGSGAPNEAPTIGAVEPAPGSDSAVYAPNPGAIVVAIDPGHGGCLDWGVPDPSERGVELSEKVLTMEIGDRLRRLLEADGARVVMIRDGDEALAGDDYPDLDCTGPAWRDVDGDGNAGFEETGRFRTRDELQARIDRANVARADVFVSIHINALTQDGVVYEIAATQTFFDDETTWGPTASGRLADAVQAGVVSALEPLATYDRQDRGAEAVAYYAISRRWEEGDSCEVEGDAYCKPHRGLLMPGALAEVGSITLRAEHDLLATSEGQSAVAEGLFAGLVEFFGQRASAVRIGLDGTAAGVVPAAVEGEGPPYWPAVVPDGPIRLRITNTGTSALASGARVVAGWETSDQPYLPAPPSALEEIGDPLPALAPGESVVVELELPAPPDRSRSVAWISLLDGASTLADRGSPALQLAWEAP